MALLQDRIRGLNADRGRLCVGIDPRPGSFPVEYGDPQGLERWCLDLVAATATHAAAFKPNLAFFLALGPSGLETLEATAEAARETGALVLLDGKFADIGSTASAYARFAAEVVGAEAVTVNPYMGTDAVEPFQAQGLGVFVLARTTNASAPALQAPVLETVVETFAPLGVGFVAPGNQPPVLEQVRRLAPEAPILAPGIGAQGGRAADARKAAGEGPLLVNVSRGISQAPGSFPESAAEAAAGFAADLS